MCYFNAVLHKIITSLPIYCPMFLQRYRYQLSQRNTPIINLSLSTARKDDAKKRISTSELKTHQNKVSYSDPRKFLIQHTQKAISQKFGTQKMGKTSIKNYESRDNVDLDHRESFIRTRYDLSKREGRVLAAKKYREKIWKSSDIASLIRVQQELMQSRRTEHIRRPSFQSSQKVQRYTDLLQQFAHETTYPDKSQPKKSSMAAATANNDNQKTVSNSNHRNPQLQVTNIEFMQSPQISRNPPKVLMNRQRRKQMIRRTSYVSGSQQNKRPSTTGSNLHKFQQNFIQPW